MSGELYHLYKKEQNNKFAILTKKKLSTQLIN